MEHYNPIREGLRAARQNLVPGLVLQAFALALVLGYYLAPPLQAAFAGVAALKAQWGFAYSMLSTALFGGLVPFLYLRLSPATSAANPWRAIWFAIGFWAFRGFDVDLLYRIQAALFGSVPDAPTVAKKVLVDQFVYNVVWAGPFQVLAYHWMNSGFSRKAFAGYDWKAFLTRRLPTTLISTWGVWIPMVSIIYCLPPDLQIPLFNLVLCFWVLILSALNRPKAGGGLGSPAEKP